MVKSPITLSDDESWKTPTVFVRSLIFNIYIRITSSVSFILLIPFLFFGQKAACIACKIWASNSIFAAKYIAGIDYEMVGEIPSAPAVIACKHQSAWETAIFHVLLTNTAYVCKKELMYIPLFNLFMWASGQIPVDRKAGASSIKNLIRSVRERVAAKRHVVIFPEGTRMKYGAEPDYKAGVAALYSSVDVEIFPVALDSGKFWARNSFWKRPGIITLSFLPAIEKGLSKKEFMRVLEEKTEAECKRIDALKI